MQSIDEIARAAKMLRIFSGCRRRFFNAQGRVEASIQYLSEALKKETRPSVRAFTIERLRLLHHQQMQTIIEQRKESLGGVVRAQDLSRLTAGLEEPWGVGWTLSPDGTVRSQELEQREIEKRKARERYLLLR